MPKFFCFTDIHGYFDKFYKALLETGYDENNQDHWLIGCGDYFDRGRQPVKVLNFLNNRKRCILVKGNHETMLKEMIERGYPKDYDTSNGSTQTIIDIFKSSPYYKDYRDADPYEKFHMGCKRAKFTILPFIDKMINFFETENYIFVHGWIPVDEMYVIGSNDVEYRYNPNWRDFQFEKPSKWEEARWHNGMAMYQKGIIEPNKTICCGHWHCSYGHAQDKGNSSLEFGKEANFSPWCKKGIIAFDACTAYSKKVNILVIEDEF